MSLIKTLAKKLKSSVSVVAMVTTIILLLLSASLVNMVYFSMMNSEREAEIQRGRWFLEGRVQEYFDTIIVGRESATPGKFQFKEKIENKEQSYQLEIRRRRNNYMLIASMKWKNKYRVEQAIEFSQLNLFDYVLFFNGNRTINLKKNMIVAGKIGVKGTLSIQNNIGNTLYYCLLPQLIPTIEFSGEKPIITPFYFNSELNELLKSPFPSYNYEAVKINKEQVLKRNTMLNNIKLPTFDAIWSAYTKYKDVAWTITDDDFFDTKAIINPLTSEKELIAFGDGFSTSYDAGTDNVKNVYLKKTFQNYKYQNIFSTEYSYYYGAENKNKYFQTENGILYLKASMRTVPILLPEETFRIFGRFYLSGEDWSMISRDERIANLYFNRAQPNSELLNGIDYELYFHQKYISILSEAFYKRHTWLIGTGTGTKFSFPVGNLKGRNYIYNDGQRTTAFSGYGNTLVFNTPPANGAMILGMNDPPQIYFRKSPPDENTGIFIDRVDNAVIIDLSEIQNYPEHGVIISTFPVYVKGTASQPIAIISSEAIYVESINEQPDSEPVMLVSRTGVWIYRLSQATTTPALHKVFIYSPLKGLYTITDTGEWSDTPINIYGTVIFNYENAEGAMDLDLFEKNYIYYRGIQKYITTEPFSIFPLPVNIETVRRS